MTDCPLPPRQTYSMWERRAPLAPTHVAQLINNGVPVFFQPSSRRAFPDNEVPPSLPPPPPRRPLSVDLDLLVI